MKRLVIDTETTGLYPSRHQVLTVGMVLVDFQPKKIEFTSEKHIFVKHDEYRYSRAALQMNGINLEEHHKIGIFPEAAHKEMKKFVDIHLLHDTPVLGHNVHFDINFLNSLFDELKVNYPFCKKREDTRYMWENLQRRGLVNPFKDAKLGTVAGHFGIDYSRAHNAIEDCKITAKVYKEILEIRGGA